MPSLIPAFLENGVFVAIIAQGLIGISLIWDKILLKRPQTQNLASYVFWLGFISVFGLFLIPFGFNFPGTCIALLAFAMHRHRASGLVLLGWSKRRYSVGVIGCGVTLESVRPMAHLIASKYIC
jgi:hypothetical protein